MPGPGQREASPVEAEPRLEERHVEHLAVEGDQAIEARQLLRQRVEQRRLLVVVPHEVLADDEAVALHPADADQEGGGSRPAGEAGRLGVEEHGSAQVEAVQLRLRGEDPDGGRTDRVDARERHVAVAHLQVDRGLDAEELAALVLDPHPLDELLERDGGGPPPLRLLDRGDGHEPLETRLQGEHLAVARRLPQHLALESLEAEGAGRVVAGGPRRRLGATQALEAAAEDPHRLCDERPPGAAPDGDPSDPLDWILGSAPHRGSPVATALPLLPTSPAGPTHEGQPSVQGQAAMSDRLSASSRSWRR